VEDSRQTSFAGVFESYINIPERELADKLRDCYMSVFSDHALDYARRNGISLKSIRMAAVIQPVAMPSAAGVAFTCEPETGCDTNVVIQSAFGFGEAIVSGELLPDTFIVNKHTGSIIRRSVTHKPFQYVAADWEGGGVMRQSNLPASSHRASLTDGQLQTLFQLVRQIEADYGSPADIEWVLTDGGRFVIVQVRPLTLAMSDESFVRYELRGHFEGEPVATGQPITDHIVVGNVRRAHSKEFLANPGDVIVARHIDVDWTPSLRNATAVITEGGGYTSHIAIILREMGIPSLFGAEGAFDALPEKETVTVACNARPGAVWRGALDISKEAFDLSHVYHPRTRVHLVSSSLSGIDKLLRLPLNGIGLVRLEFLISDAIGIHPMAIADYAAGRDLPDHVASEIFAKSSAYGSADEFYVTTLAESICGFASRCPGKVVNVRFADLLTDDYLSLIGGDVYETQREANPMLGWRGTTRLIDDDYRSAFVLDCRAFRLAIDELGFTNINLLLPFCRMPEDARAAIELIRTFGPSRARIGMMVEVPSNVALAKEFSDLVDFFLVGPMDMTQLTYGADRKAKKLSKYNNQTAATKEMVKMFLQRISGSRKEVFIGGWPLFQYLPEYRQVQTNNILHLVELPDRLLELFENLRELEGRGYAAEGTPVQCLSPLAASW
jgi:pyruvate,water dikinase